MDARIREEYERIEQLLLEAENEEEESMPDSPDFWAKLREEEGKYSSAAEFVSALIQEARKKATIAQINAKLKEGLACPERIELTPDFWLNERRRLDEFIRSEGLE
jgi:Arc/MetJ-type ribon-helix-helix transcriptional regulator